MTDKLEIGGLYRFHAPKDPGVFTGPWRDMTWSLWDELQNAFNENWKPTPVAFKDGTVFLIVDYKPLHIFNGDPKTAERKNVIWMHKVLINDVCGWTLIDKDPELWDNYMTTFDDCLERL